MPTDSPSDFDLFKVGHVRMFVRPWWGMVKWVVMGTDDPEANP